MRLGTRHPLGLVRGASAPPCSTAQSRPESTRRSTPAYPVPATTIFDIGRVAPNRDESAGSCFSTHLSARGYHELRARLPRKHALRDGGEVVRADARVATGAPQLPIFRLRRSSPPKDHPPGSESPTVQTTIGGASRLSLGPTTPNLPTQCKVFFPGRHTPPHRPP